MIKDLEFWEYLANSVICGYIVSNNYMYGNMEELTSYLGMFAIWYYCWLKSHTKNITRKILVLQIHEGVLHGIVDWKNCHNFAVYNLNRIWKIWGHNWKWFNS
jgi:hypothetical protein